MSLRAQRAMAVSVQAMGRIVTQACFLGVAGCISLLRGTLPADAAERAHECIVKHLRSIGWVDGDDEAVAGQTGCTVEYFTGSVRDNGVRRGRRAHHMTWAQRLAPPRATCGSAWVDLLSQWQLMQTRLNTQ
jgi:hypothetical protein